MIIKYKPTLFYQILFLFICSNIFGQGIPPKKEYDLDKDDTHFKSELDFHSEILANVKSPKNIKFRDVGYYFVQDYSKKIKLRKYEIDGSFSIEQVKKSDDKNNNWLLNISDLHPNRSFKFLIPQSIDESALHELHSINNLLFLEYLTQDFKNRKEIKSKYEKLVNSLNISSLENINSFINKKQIGSHRFEKYISDVFISDIHPQLNAAKEIYEINGKASDIESYVNMIQTGKIEKIIGSLSSIKTSIGIKDQPYRTNLELLERIKKYKKLPELLYGLIPLNLDNFPDNVNYSDSFIARKRNLTELKNVLEKITEISLASKLGISEECLEVLKKTNKILKTFEEIEKILYNPGKGVFTFRIIEGTTIPSMHSDHISTIIKSDIGISTIFTREDVNFGLRSNVIRPYFGIKFHPWKLDDDSSFETVRKRSRLFLHLGLTIGSIEDASMRTDLFNTNNLLIGGGFALSRSVHFSAGTILYKSEDINPLLDDETGRFGLYISLGIQPNLNTIISTFTGLISR